MQQIDPKHTQAILIGAGKFDFANEAGFQDLPGVNANLAQLIARALFALKRFEQASDEFKQAVSGMRKAGKVNFMPEVLLERAKFHRHQQDFKQCQTDLDEAQEIIDRCGMNLYAVDAALLRGNLNLDLKAYKIAKELIAKTGYHLRDGELAELGSRLGI